MMKKINAIPAKQRVIFLPDTNPEKVGNIYIPTSAERETPRIGTLVRVGKGEKDVPMEYLVGQRVVVSKDSGIDIELNLLGTDGPKTYLVMNQMDIMMIIEEVEE